MTSAPLPKLVLVADDDAAACDLVMTAIELMGSRCVCVHDGEEAVAFFRETTPDLAILDVMMPKLSGLEVCSRVKEISTGTFIPVLMLTARDGLQAKVEALENGADDYLTKPFHLQELQARVRSLLRIRDLSVELNAKNEELRRVQAELIEKERQLVAVQLGGAAAHSMGQPISAILLNCHLLRILPPEDPKREQAVQAIEIDARRLKTYLEQLRSVDASATERYSDTLEIIRLCEAETTLSDAKISTEEINEGLQEGNKNTKKQKQRA